MRKTITLVISLCLGLFSTVSGDEPRSRIVETTQGPVRGYRDPEGGLFAFYSIPYATAPSGPLKFTAPITPPTWTEPFEAVDKRIICPQMKSGFTKQMTMQVDCLIANVFVPDTKETKLPVIVYVHGGAFQVGFGNLMTPKNLVRSKNIIAVTFNYRLGAHGFLCLGTEDAPGNAGLKDQVAALRWVNKNIIKLGGNPDDVTIAGYSAGAISVDLMAISKSAEGLFSKIIIESGSSLFAGSIVTDPLENAKIFAARLGFNNIDDVYALEKFYKAASYDSLTKGEFMDRPNSTLLFSPCVERDDDGLAFLSEPPINILKEGSYTQVPMIYGFSNMEGLFREPFFEFWKLKMNEQFSEFIPGDLHFESKHDRERIAKRIKKFYFWDSPINGENILKYIDYFGDVLVKYPALRTVKMHIQNGHDKLYLYEYSYVDENGPAVIHTTNTRGANHCAQTVAVLDGQNMTLKKEDNLPEDFKIVKDVIRDFWTNFAKLGSPVPDGSDLPAWPPVVDEKLSPYMDISESPELRGEMMPDRVQFWDELYNRYYRPPKSPPRPPAHVHTEL
ncbi:hypothetical protein O0L34_g12285 [Tuta absoluta]|nr:hypothetical protein O0L34_g12285 [Tuta absoluta]